jgi:hypothetical protein
MRRAWLKNKSSGLGAVTHTYNPRIIEVETGRIAVWGQPRQKVGVTSISTNKSAIVAYVCHHSYAGSRRGIEAGPSENISPYLKNE